MLPAIIKHLETEMLKGKYAKWSDFLVKQNTGTAGEWVYREVAAFLLAHNYPLGAYTLMKEHPSIAHSLNTLVCARLDAAHTYFEQHIRNDLRQHQLERLRECLEKNLSLLLPKSIISSETSPASLLPQTLTAIQRLFEENDICTDILIEARIINPQSSIEASATTDIDSIIEKLQTIIEQRKAEQLERQKITNKQDALYAVSRTKSDDHCLLRCTIM